MLTETIEMYVIRRLVEGAKASDVWREAQDKFAKVSWSDVQRIEREAKNYKPLRLTRRSVH